jgi:diacylglycerol kinase family enzyme
MEIRLSPLAQVQYKLLQDKNVHPMKSPRCKEWGMSRPDLCVIFNPVAGRGQAARRLARLGKQWGARACFEPTRHPGHAVELARQAALADFRIVAAAGGDGTVHEVANGLLRARRHEVQFGILPLGSANDYYASLQLEPLADPSAVRTVDVGVVREPGGREQFFICCLGLGLNGAVTVESRKIKRLQGVALYGLATLRALWYHYRCPRMELAIDDQPVLQVPTLMLSVLAGRREGGFVMAPKAKLNDGWLDFIHAGDLSRWEVLKFLPRLALSGPPREYPKVRQGRCRRVKLTSEAPLVVHIDGEFFCVPEENVHSLEIEIVPAALTIATL